MAWVKIPKEHHPLFRAALPDDPRIEQVIEMFGGVAAIVQGHMACGLWAESAVVRVGPKEWAQAVKRGGEPFSPMGTAVMKDQVVLPKATLHDNEELGHWLQLAIDFTSSLPYNEKKRKLKTPKKAPAKKAPAKKAPSKKTPAKKTPAEKAPAKKAPAKKAPAKKAPAKKAPGKKTPASESAAKKTRAAKAKK